MRSTSDPTRCWRRRERGLLVGGIAVFACSLAWALWPLGRFPTIDSTLERTDPGEDGPQAIEPFDRTAFAARLWNPPRQPAPVIAAALAEDTPPPPRLQLIGIVHDVDAEGASVLRAALYDPDTHKLHVVTCGESVGGLMVAAIDQEGVSLDAGGRETRLALRDEGGPR